MIISYKSARYEATLAVAEAGITLELYRIDTGNYPEALNDIPSTAYIPSDPFTDNSLQYKRTPTGFLLYSVGPNRKDDNGTTRKESKDDYDISWQIQRP